VNARPLAVVVLAAGLGTRMRSKRAKVLHELGGRPLLHYPLLAMRALAPTRVVLVVGHQADLVRAAATGVETPGLEAVLQAEQRGTGHAMRCAFEVLSGFAGDVVVLYGDVPMIRTETLQALVTAHRRDDVALTLLTLHFSNPTGYGRIVRDGDGRVQRIVEERDATPAERAITEINPGFYCIRSEVLGPLLARLRPNNVQGELYLTDVVGMAAADRLRVSTVPVADADEVAGINTHAELAGMEARVRETIVRRLMAAGVTFEDPATAYVGAEVEIGQDTVIGPNVVLRGRTRIGSGCRLDGTNFLVDTIVGDGTHLLFGTVADGAEIGPDAKIGPYARLRPGTQLGARVHIGNFVEMKKAIVAAGTKANHLSYLGDCEIGPDTNVGAGTITCNYDGFKKSVTRIGARVQIGSDTQLVAPVRVGDDAYVAAGTTVTRDVPPGALAVSRVPVRFVEGWTERKRKQEAGSAKKKGG
jgi:bifunctional UDP-N-acetylglucosamine pyrophosphorylase/glucosamine-1-phosphate N-acetyltransferase